MNKSRVKNWIQQFIQGNLTIRYRATLSILALSLIISQIIVQFSFDQKESHLQKIQFFKNHLKNIEIFRKTIFQIKLKVGTAPPENQENNPFHHATQEAQEKFQRFHLALFKGPGHEEAGDFPAFHDLYKKIQKGTQDLLTSPSAMPSNSSLHSLLENLEQYDHQFQRYVIGLEKTSAQQIKSLRQLEFFLFLFVLVILIAQAVFIFQPAIRKMEELSKAKSEFFGKIGHEIKNPMNLIMGLGDILARTPLNLVQKEYLFRLQNAVQRPLNYLNSLLEYSSLENNKGGLKENICDLRKEIESLGKIFSLDIQNKGLDFHLETDLSLPRSIIIDQIKFQQIVTNLLGNALKFTDKGHIGLKFRRGSGENRLEMVVTDTGIGIEKEKADFIFQSFYQIDSPSRKKYVGSGLGLFITDELVTLMGGNIKISSVPHQGTTFVVDIPYKTRDRDDEKIMVPPTDPAFLPLQTLILDAGDHQNLWNTMLPSPFFETTLIKSSEHIDPSFDLLIISFEALQLPFPPDLRHLQRFWPEGRPLWVVAPANVPYTHLEDIFPLDDVHILIKPLFPWSLRELSLSPISPSHFPSPPPSRPPTPPSSSLHLLVVEDDVDNQYLYQLFLEGEKYRFTFARNGEEALFHLQKEKGRFCLVLMDYHLNETDGFTVARQIRQFQTLHHPSSPEIPILMVTGQNDPSLRETAEAMGIKGLLPKPFSQKDLLEAVEKFLPSSPGSLPSQRARDILNKRLPQYLQRRREDLANLKVAFDKGDFETIRMITHKIKGNASTYGFVELADWALEMENGSREANKTLIRPYLKKMERFLTHHLPPNLDH